MRDYQGICKVINGLHLTDFPLSVFEGGGGEEGVPLTLVNMLDLLLSQGQIQKDTAHRLMLGNTESPRWGNCCLVICRIFQST